MVTEAFIAPLPPLPAPTGNLQPAEPRGGQTSTQILFTLLLGGIKET